MLKNFLMDETGAELAEYAVAIALLVAVALVIYQVLGQGLSDANSATGRGDQERFHHGHPVIRPILVRQKYREAASSQTSGFPKSN